MPMFIADTNDDSKRSRLLTTHLAKNDKLSEFTNNESASVRHLHIISGVHLCDRSSKLRLRFYGRDLNVLVQKPIEKMTELHSAANEIE